MISPTGTLRIRMIACALRLREIFFCFLSWRSWRFVANRLKVILTTQIGLL